jgi:hypothetical protein
MNSAAQIEANRRYRDTHRDEINARRRGQGYIRPDVAKTRREAFAAALDEITDPDVRRELDEMLGAMIAFFMANGLKQFAAENQALEFLAACVCNGVNAPRRNRTIAAVSGD